MRKPKAAAVAVTTAIAARHDAPVELVCLALMLALAALMMRIATVW